MRTTTPIEFIINHDLTFENYYQGTKLYYQNTVPKRRITSLGIFFVLLSTFGLYFEITITGIIILLIGISLIFFKKPLLYTYSFLLFSFAKIVCGKTTYIFHKNGITVVSQNKLTENKWELFQYFYNHSNIIIYRKLKFGHIGVNIIPKEYFSQDQWLKLLDFVRQHITIRDKVIESKKVIWASNILISVNSLFTCISLIMIYLLFVSRLGLVGFNLDPKFTHSLSYVTPFITFSPLILYYITLKHQPLKTSLIVLIGNILIVLILFFAPIIISVYLKFN